MNEHTKLLIMKAGGIICSTEATGHIDKIDYLHFDAEKFAELIVKECLAKAEEEAELYRGFSHLGGAEYAKVMYNYQLLLKEHFGVDE
jgi:hypothetical protein